MLNGSRVFPPREFNCGPASATGETHAPPNQKNTAVRRTWSAFLLSVLLPLTASAQETRGNISGTVRDSQAVVPGAAVTITNVDTKVSQRLVTNGSGYFEAPLLNPGNYEVTVQLQGFRPRSRTNIVLAVGQTVSLTITLEVGE